MHTLLERGFLRLPAVLQVFPVSRSAWWAGVKTGKYPKSVKLGPRTTVWRTEDIFDLLESSAAGNAPRGEKQAAPRVAPQSAQAAA
jgi:predicted DNA-binding transcriptional regulator AlpA